MKKMLVAIGLVVGLASTANAEVIGKVTTSGWFFKDTIKIHEFKDPSIDGIACHITYADKAFNTDDPSNSSISCRQTKGVITGVIESRENVFKKNKNLFFKVMRVDRFYDSINNSLVYISYTKKTSGENASHSISSVPLWNAKVVLPNKK